MTGLIPTAELRKRVAYEPHRRIATTLNREELREAVDTWTRRVERRAVAAEAGDETAVEVLLSGRSAVQAFVDEQNDRARLHALIDRYRALGEDHGGAADLAVRELSFTQDAITCPTCGRPVKPVLFHRHTCRPRHERKPR